MTIDLGFVGRVAVSVLFAASCAGKLRTHQFGEFVISLQRFSIPKRSRKAVAVGVIAAEGALVVALVLPITARIAGVAAALLLTVFTIALLGRLRQGDRAPCNCFGNSTRPLGAAGIIRNCTGIAGASLAATHADWPGWAAALPLAVAGVVVGLVLVFADTIADLFTTPKELERT